MIIIFTSILILLFVLCDAFQDAITNHFDTSIFRDLNIHYFNPVYSWQNKYKDISSRTPKFFGSTTFLVWTTDFWHLLKFIKMNCICIMIAIYTYWWMYILFIIAWGVMFELFYRLSR